MDRIQRFTTPVQIRFAQVLDALGAKFTFSDGCFSLLKQNINIIELSYNMEISEKLSSQNSKEKSQYYLHPEGRISTAADEGVSIVFCKKCNNFYFAPQSDAKELHCPFCNNDSKKYLTRDGRIPAWYGKTIEYIVDEKIAKNHCSDDEVEYDNKHDKIIKQLSGKPKYITVSDEMISKVKELAEKYPNMQEVIEFLVINLTTSKFKQNKELSFMPLLLVGGPGCGKSSFAKDLCLILMGKPALKIDLGNGISDITLTGSDPKYSRSDYGLIVKSMIDENGREPLKNPVIHFDEIDKLNPKDSNCADKTFYSILEPNNACQFYDNFLGFNVDASGINYIFTANNLEKIQSPILNRLKIFQIQDYTHEQLKNTVMDSFYSSWIKTNHIKEDIIPAKLSDFIKDKILEIAKDNPRSINSAINEVFMQTMIHEENDKLDIALFSPDELYQGWKKFRGQRSFTKELWKLPEGFIHESKNKAFDPVEYLENLKVG